MTSHRIESYPEPDFFYGTFDDVDWIQAHEDQIIACIPSSPLLTIIEGPQSQEYFHIGEKLRVLCTQEKYLHNQEVIAILERLSVIGLVQYWNMYGEDGKITERCGLAPALHKLNEDQWTKASMWLNVLREDKHTLHGDIKDFADFALQAIILTSKGKKT